MTAMTRYARYILLPGVLVAASLPDAQAAKNSLAAERPLTYVVLGERAHALRGETVALLRVVLATSTGNPCVRLSIAGTQGRRLEPIIERRNPDSRRFPITVCEAILPFSNVFSTSGESWRAELDGKTYPLRLPTVVKTPERVLIVGDSGCRDNKRQSCDDEQWPFRTAIPRDMARLIADEGKPTLLLMVGDYNYRQEKKSSSPDRQWRNWLADFFTPMTGGSQDKNRKKTAPSGKDDSIGHLLTMAPLVLARGDHELCAPANEKGGAGWYFLLEPTSPLLGDADAAVLGASCSDDDRVPESIGAPFRLDFDNRFSLLLTDSAAIADSKRPDEEQAKALAHLLARAETNFKADNSPERLAWWVTHKPVWSVVGTDKPKVGNATAQSALKERQNAKPPANIKLIVSGDKHFYQSIDAGGQPLQLVVGNGGVEINNNAFNGRLGAIDAEVRTASRHGFVDARLTIDNRVVKGWTLNSYAYPSTAGRDHRPELIQTCRYPAPAAGKACTVVKPAYFEPIGNSRDEEGD